MESVLSFSKKCHEDTYKFTKKAMISQGLWVVFNIAILCFDWQTFTLTSSKVSSVSFGAMLVTALWSFVFWWQTWDELRTAKHHIKFLTELENTQIASGEREQLKQARDYYNQLIEQLKEKQNDKGI